MSNLYIVGRKPLKGSVKVSGSKNEVLKLIAASIVTKGTLVIKNAPEISDVIVLCEILKKMGAKFSLKDNVLKINCDDIKSVEPDSKFVGKLRASIVLIGPMLARFGKIKIAYPGGDAIGARQIDTHIEAFEALGAQVKRYNKKVEIKIGEVKDTKVKLREKSVTATENILLFASAKENKITIENCALEPEIIDLVKFLSSAGAKIKIVNGRKIKVQGKANLASITYSVIPDRIEAGTYITAILSTGGEATVENIDARSIQNIIDFFVGIGAKIDVSSTKIVVHKSNLKPFHVRTGVYPDFPTDMQAPLSVLATRIQGISTINERLYKNRFSHLKQMEKMGLKYKVIDENNAWIYGKCDLKGVEINVTDLRAGATLVLAGLIAHGRTIVKRAEIIDRGYEDIVQKLQKLQADIKRK